MVSSFVADKYHFILAASSSFFAVNSFKYLLAMYNLFVMDIFDKISKAKEDLIKEGKRYSSTIDHFFFSTLWFSYALNSLEKNQVSHFIFDIVRVMSENKFSTLSIIAVIFNENIQNEIQSIFDKYEIPFVKFSSFENTEDYDIITTDFIKEIYSRESLIFKHLILNVFCLLLTKEDSKLVVSLDSQMEMLEKYNGKNDTETLDRWVSLCISSFLGILSESRVLVGSGYILFESMKTGEGYFLEQIESARQNIDFIKPEELNFNTLNLLTGNGFSKYVTKKILNDDWLLKPILYKELRKSILKKQNDILESYERLLLIPNINNDETTYIEKILIAQANRNIEYLESHSFINDLFGAVENFILTRESLSEKIGPSTEINDELFEKIGDLDFKTSNRRFLIEMIMFSEFYELIYNTEFLLMIFDKYYNHFERKNEDEIDKKYIFIHLLTESILELIWKKGKINSMNLPKNKISFENVFTLNYDNITDQIFGKAIHLHGEFEMAFDVNRTFDKDGVETEKTMVNKEIKIEIGKSIAETIGYPNQTHSTVLKGGDYKFDYINNVFQSTSYYKDNFEILANAKGDFLLLGTNCIADPHIISILSNVKRNLYITYFSESEIPRIKIFKDLVEKSNLNITIYIIEFNSLMNHMEI